MLNEEKIRKMIRLSEYEQGVGKRDLARVSLLKMDYVRLSVLKTLVSVIISAVLFLGLLTVYHMEYILKNALSLPYMQLALWGGISFGVVVLVSILVTLKMASRQYEESALRAREYYETLEELKKQNGKWFFQALLCLEAGVKPNTIKPSEYQALELTYAKFAQIKKAKVMASDWLDTFESIDKNGAFYMIESEEKNND